MKYCSNSAERIWILVLTCLFCLVVTSYGQMTNIMVSPTPDWVRPLSWQPTNHLEKNGKSEGTRCLLYDYQENPRQEEQYTAIALLMKNEAGVQDAGNLTFAFNPAFQTLIFHRVQIHRSGQILDRLDPSKLKIIQPEPALNQYLFTGQQSALLFVEDLRVGDILEYAYTVRGANSVFNGHYSTRLIVQSNISVDYQRLRILWPPSVPLYMRQHLTNVAPKSAVQDGMTEFIWDFCGLEGIPYEDVLPGGYEPYPYFEFSDFKDWAQVVEWALPLYDAEHTNMPPELRTLIDQWNHNAASSQEKARMAVQFVQDEIRYTGIELGTDSHHPAHPFETFQMRYGDCKGKSSLLCTILRELHVEAYPALVNTSIREEVEQRLPSPSAFDHVIVKIILNEQPIWVDPTRSRQGGGLKSRYLPLFKKALVIKKGVNALEEVSRTLGRSEQCVVTTFDIMNYRDPVLLTVKTSYSGWEADNIREYFARTDVQDIAKNSLNFMVRYYPGIYETKPLQVSDDRAGNHLEITEHYAIKDLWTPEQGGSRQQAVFYAENMYNTLTDPQIRFRKMPLGQIYPLHREQEVVINLPDKEWEIPVLEQKIEDDAFSFRFYRAHSNSTVRISYMCETRSPRVAAEAVCGYLKKREEIQGLLATTLYHADKAAGSGTNWLMVVVACFGTITTAACCWWLWRIFGICKTKGRSSDVHFRHRDTHLQGLSGWLLLVGIGLCFGPLMRLIGLWPGLGGYFSMQAWQSAAIPSGANYHPLYGPMLIFELLGNIWFMGFNLMLIGLYFGKRRAFPIAYIILLITNTIFLGLDRFMVSQTPLPSNESATELVKSIFSSVIWTMYMLKSRRVKATFVQ